ncbi:MAG: YiiD C-terminal domain-containing protein [Planctomycetales bacterium]|nr:YiiD C-terminal domain-containing protein [Planctomycetales bacterium]
MEQTPLSLLHETMLREMPITQAMGISAAAWDGRRLAVEMPLAANRNHQDSAFAGSLSALCTITGWGKVFLMLRARGLDGNIVIRRSQIRYLRPVRDATIRAASLPVAGDAAAYFFELLLNKGKSKVDVSVEIADADGPYVKFTGSYVVQEVTEVGGGGGD